MTNVLQKLRRMNKPEITAVSAIREKWGSALDSGFVVCPSILLLRQKQLGLESGELAVLLNLIMAWWKVDELPFPSSVTIAKRIGVSNRTVQRQLRSLEVRGFIARSRNLLRNKADRAITTYDLSGLVAKLQGAMPQGQSASQLNQIDLAVGEIELKEQPVTVNKQRIAVLEVR